MADRNVEDGENIGLDSRTSNDVEGARTDGDEDNVEAPLRGEMDSEVPALHLDSEESRGIRLFCLDVCADLKNRALIPIKLIFFFKYGALFVLLPFFTLHLKSLGLDSTEVGFNSSVIPLVSIFGPILAGVIADKIGNFKIFMAGVTLLQCPIALMLLLVPKARETVILPETLTLSLSCGSARGLASVQQFFLQTIDSSSCQLINNGSYESLPPRLIQCGMTCSSLDSASDSFPPYDFNLSGTTGSFRLPHSPTTSFSPTTRTPFLDCRTSSSNINNCSVKLGQEVGNQVEPLPFQISTLTLMDAFEPGSTKVVTRPKFLIGNEMFVFGKTRLNSVPRCSMERGAGSGSNLSTEIDNCRMECLVQYERSIFCSNTEDEQVYNVGLTLGLYTLCRLLLVLLNSTSFVMFDGAVLATIKEYGGDYGLQRVSATFAGIIGAPLSGSLIQLFQSYEPAFYLYAALQTLTALLCLFVDLTFKPPASKIVVNLKQVLSQTEILIFFIIMLVTGTTWGYLESFFFWFLQELNASGLLMGLTVSVGNLAGIPMLVFSGPIIKRLGHVNILSFSLILYCVRLIGYSYIQNPWTSLLFEAMEGFTVSLAMTTAVTYAAGLSTTETIASIQGIMGGLYYGFGRGLGSLFGGFLHKWYGSRTTFRIFAAVTTITGILYFLFNLLYLRKHSKLLQNKSPNTAAESDTA